MITIIVIIKAETKDIINTKVTKLMPRCQTNSIYILYANLNLVNDIINVFFGNIFHYLHVR